MDEQQRDEGGGRARSRERERIGQRREGRGREGRELQRELDSLETVSSPNERPRPTYPAESVAGEEQARAGRVGAMRQRDTKTAQASKYFTESEWGDAFPTDQPTPFDPSGHKSAAYRARQPLPLRGHAGAELGQGRGRGRSRQPAAADRDHDDGSGIRRASGLARERGDTEERSDVGGIGGDERPDVRRRDVGGFGSQGSEGERSDVRSVERRKDDERLDVRRRDVTGFGSQRSGGEHSDVRRRDVGGFRSQGSEGERSDVRSVERRKDDERLDVRRRNVTGFGSQRSSGEHSDVRRRDVGGFRSQGSEGERSDVRRDVGGFRSQRSEGERPDVRSVERRRDDERSDVRRRDVAGFGSQRSERSDVRRRDVSGFGSQRSRGERSDVRPMEQQSDDDRSDSRRDMGGFGSQRSDAASRRRSGLGQFSGVEATRRRGVTNELEWEDDDRVGDPMFEEHLPSTPPSIPRAEPTWLRRDWGGIPNRSTEGGGSLSTPLAGATRRAGMMLPPQMREGVAGIPRRTGEGSRPKRLRVAADVDDSTSLPTLPSGPNAGESSVRGENASQGLRAMIPPETSQLAEFNELGSSAWGQGQEEDHGEAVDEQPWRVYVPPAGKRYRYDLALEEGCLAVLDLAWVHAKSLCYGIADEIDEPLWRQLGKNILWSMPSTVLDGLVNGSIALDYSNTEYEGVFSQETPWMAESRQNAPVIYAYILASWDGVNLTPEQLRRVIARLRSYVSMDDIEDALEVDNAFDKLSSRRDLEGGKHFFLSRKKAGRRRRVLRRVEVVNRFCDALERRLDGLTDEEQTEPLARALHYIGYAFCFADRHANHAQGTTSFLMHLVSNVCQLLWPDQYNLFGYPLCFLVEKDEVRLGELLLTLLSDSLSDTGGGFNIHPPGINNSSADLDDAPNSFVAGFWAKRRRFRVAMGHWEMNKEAELDRIRAREEPDSMVVDAGGESEGDEVAMLQREGELTEELNREAAAIRAKIAVLDEQRLRRR